MEIVHNNTVYVLKRSDAIEIVKATFQEQLLEVHQFIIQGLFVIRHMKYILTNLVKGPRVIMMMDM